MPTATTSRSPIWTSHGVALQFTLSNPDTLVAYTTDASHPVFTVTLSAATAAGSYNFVLDQPLDQLPGTGGALNLAFSYAVQDFDGSVTSCSFTITDTDDAPIAHQVTAAAIPETVASLVVTPAAGTSFAFGADGPAATGSISFDTAHATIAGPAGETFGTPTYVINGGSASRSSRAPPSRSSAPGQSATLDITPIR